MKRRNLVLAALASLLAWAAPVLASAAEPVTVFAAASLKNALDEAAADYTRQSGAAVHTSYAASSALARQIVAGAPADLFISADSDWMDWLVQQHGVVIATRRDLWSNHLALIAPADSRLRLRVGPGMALAKALAGGRLAVAGPDVPAGKYAKAALISLGVFDSVQGQLAPADNVRGALLFVARGECPLGIVYDTDAKVEPKVRIVGLFPDASHPKIVYPGAVTAGSPNPQGAASFLGFLAGPRGRAVFAKYGFVALTPR
ncbi:MAG: molybdate ABC transporter substrate-binding protein [Caulobacterales bacterium]